MLGYIATVQEFSHQSTADIVRQLAILYPNASASQNHSWEVLIDDIKASAAFRYIPDSAIIGLELSLFVENRSVDLVIAGSTPTKENIAFLIESKQWGDDYIRQHRFSDYRENDKLLYPQIQAHHYVVSLRDYIKTKPAITQICPFVYMRNASHEGCRLLRIEDSNTAAAAIPVLNSIHDIFDIIANELADTTALSVRSFREATYSPSVSIINAMHAIVTHEAPFVLTNEQEHALRQIWDLLSAGKRVIQINGGAGSGKTAILLNIYVQMLRQRDRFVPFFVSGAQNTYLYKSLFPQVADSFHFSLSLKNTIRNLQNGVPIILLDEAQHNQAGILSELLSHPSAKIIFCYDEWQTIHANNALTEITGFRQRDDFASIDLNNSVRFNNSPVFETNVKSYLTSAQPPAPDTCYDFRVLSSFDALKAQTYDIITDNPDAEVALIGLLSDNGHQMAQGSDGFMHIAWASKAETDWIPYVKGRNYLSQNNGSLWVGTWWMPGLDVDYAIVIVGNDAKITPNGLVGIPRHSKNYLMMIGIAEQLGLPDRIMKANTSHAKKVEAILHYLDLPQNAACKATFHDRFTFYLRNMYYVMMTRGRKGCFVYFQNQSQQKSPLLP